MNLATPANSTRVNRGEFNVALALVALAQKNMGILRELYKLFAVLLKRLNCKTNVLFDPKLIIDISIENLIVHKQGWFEFY